MPEVRNQMKQNTVLSAQAWDTVKVNHVQRRQEDGKTARCVVENPKHTIRISKQLRISIFDIRNSVAMGRFFNLKFEIWN